ncbi:MAG: aldehyde dehydrogenase family protein [Actinomycetia bacterium]|nr:aldehyde dehydrogenase family protein [Actinomycetes bacterium]
MPLTTVAADIDRLRRTFDSGKTRSYEWRISQLEALLRMLDDQETRFVDALAGDMHRSEVEAITADLAVVRNDTTDAIKHLKKWMKPEPTKKPAVLGIGAKVEVIHEPLGVALIIGAWNYPIMLTLGPLVGAIAAGCCAVLKPSELSKASAVAIERSVAEYLDPDAFAVVQGSIPETTEILEQRYDHVFFTGSPAVGRIVMAAAAKHLTPVTLELGGKSPAIVAADADLAVAAKRITQGKFFNAGQTCIGVDYVMVEEAVAQELTDLVVAEVKNFYGEDPKTSIDFARIINAGNFDRLVALIAGEEIALGGENDSDQLYIAPTVLVGVDPQAPVMMEEIFGPLLPILTVANIDEAIAIVHEGEKPLALYVFSKDKAIQEEVINQTSSGGACINDTLTHLAMPEAPFGGVGESGIGQYHGYDGYLTFTHRRTVVKRTTKIDPDVRYPPYGPVKGKIAEKLA